MVFDQETTKWVLNISDSMAFLSLNAGEEFLLYTKPKFTYNPGMPYKIDF